MLLPGGDVLALNALAITLLVAAALALLLPSIAIEDKF